jgi:hypothetical protein
VDDIDVIRSYLGGDDEAVVLRHEIKQWLAFRHDAARSPDPKIGDDTVLGRTHLSAGEDVCSSFGAFGELEDERLDLAEALSDLGLPIATQLKDLGMGLAHPLLGARHLFLRLTLPSVDLGLLSLERQLTRLGDDPLATSGAMASISLLMISACFLAAST